MITFLLRRARRIRRSGDAGLALPTVFGLALVMLIMVTASLTVANSGTTQANNDKDWDAALWSAYAGVEEYQSRLANDSTYVLYGNKDAKFSKDTGSTTLVAPPKTNPAFGFSNSWATVPGSDGTALYRYEVDNSKYQSSGVLRLRSPGMVGSSVRTIVANLKQSGFINFLYFTDKEVQDPQFTGKDYCDAYAYGDNARPVGSGSNQCQIIQFGRSDAADVFDGPVHSNDKLYVCNAKFNRGVESASKDDLYQMVCSGTPKPSVKIGSNIPIPPTNTSDRATTFTNATRPGCLYTGPTTITFFMSGSVAKMNIVSPWTIQTNPNPGETTGTSYSYCGNVNDMHTAAGSTVDALDTNLMYVQDVPDKSSNNVNGWTVGTYPNWSGGNKFTCNGTPSIDGWKFGSSQYPVSNEVTPLGAASDALAYGCRKGDAYVSGTYGSATTISAENYIYVTGDIKRDDPANDMLGLVGNNAIVVYSPVRCSGSTTLKSDGSGCSGSGSFQTLLASGYDRTIEAAILSVQHTFIVQNYSRVTRGTLYVTGSIAQKFRGPVGQGTLGYIKNYGYDARFLSTAPPKFLTPTSTTYGVTQFANVEPAFNTDGSSTGK
jgi:hypothetical protein